MTLKLKFKFNPELDAISKIRPPVRIKHVLAKRYHLKRLEELSLKSPGQIPQLEYPDHEWVDRRMHGSTKSWEVWNQ